MNIMGESSAANKVFEAYTISAEHKDLVHDVAYDFYGERLATCSSDQYVKVWDSDGQGEWKLSASWKAHHGSVWKVTWAHPEFGQVLATCSFDRTAAIWEEVGETTMNAPGSERGLRQWVKRSTLVDSRTSVTDIKFGPKNLGLVLVTCSADGIIRMYEAPDVMNLSQWTLQHEIPTKVSISCLSWNPTLSRINPPMIAVGCDEPAAGSGTCAEKGGRMLLFEYGEAARRWVRTDCSGGVLDPVNDLAFAPNLGRSFHLLAVATKDVKIIKIEPLGEGAGAGAARYKCTTVGNFPEHWSCVWRVSWNVTGTLLASSGDDCAVRLWKMQYLNQWKCAGVLSNMRGAASNVQGVTPAAPVPARAHTAYLKMAAMTNPAHMPCH